jgi:hypothetical protein
MEETIAGSTFNTGGGGGNGALSRQFYGQLKHGTGHGTAGMADCQWNAPVDAVADQGLIVGDAMFHLYAKMLLNVASADPPAN